MATIRHFEEIEAWQQSRELTRAVYEGSKGRRFFRDRALREQIRRAAISVMSNIAEGFERGGNAEFVQFLAVAKGSTAEVEAQLYVALDQDYITAEEFQKVRSVTVSTRRLIAGLMHYLRRSGMKGMKYRSLRGANGTQRRK